MPRKPPPAEPDETAVEEEREAVLLSDGTPAPLVFRLMGEILAELPAIGKNQRNQEQDFMFRGYDDVLNALNPIMSRKGVFVVPDVVERVSAHRTTRNNYTMYEVNLHVRFTFYAPDGSWVAGSGWGEGTDMGDKATNKAMTNAFKYVLFQTFAISTREASETDSDRYTPDQSEADVLYCRVCQTPVDGAKSDREKMRAHLIDEHDWVRVNIGTKDEGVITPDRAAQLEKERQDQDAEGASAPTDRTPPDNADSSTVGTTSVDDGTADEIDTSWVDELKGKELVDAAKEWGVSPSGKVDEIRQRLRDAYIADVTTPADADPGTDQDGAETPAAEPEPAAEPDDTGTAAADQGDADTPPDEGGFQCPDCPEGAPTWPTEAEYNAHWYAEHDDGAAAADDASEPVGEPEYDGTSDDRPALIAKVKGAIADLKGEQARAYGKYRRDAGLPRPDDMDEDQCRGLLEFLDGLAAS